MPSRVVPASIAFELTPRCDQRCAYCYNIWKGEGGAGYAERELPTGELAALMGRAVRESGTSHLVITGGEPLLRPDAVELLEAARRLVASVSLITNGTHLDAGLARRLAGLGINVQLTFLAASADLHDELRGAASYRAALAAAVTLREAGVPLVFCFVCTRRNHAALPGVLDLAHAFGVRALAFNRMAPAGEAAQQLRSLAPTLEMIEECLGWADAAARRQGLQVTTGIPIQPCLVEHRRFPGVRFTACASASSRPNPVVAWAGRVRSCNLSSTVLGDLRKQSWAQAVRAPYLRRFARALPAGCRSCAQSHSCRAGCKEAALACQGALEEEEPFLREAREAAASR